MREENILYWIWLSECFGIAPKDFPTFVSKFDSPYEVYMMSDEETSQIDGITALHRARLCDKSLERAYSILKHCKVNGISVIPYTSAEYPARLRTIEDPPVLLYCLGKMPRMDSCLCIGMVGTRSMSEYGKQTAYKISYELAASGACIVSGMALGVDGVCACGAIEAGGRTVAVLGCGVSVVYPREHRGLMGIIQRHGAVISEFSPMTPPEAGNFPIRNRIISGLSQGVVVVEAASRSGALITARKAVSQGRTLFAVPGKVGDAQSSGPNDLIRNGANIVLCAEDVLARYEFLYGYMINRNKLAQAQKRSALGEKTLKRYGVACAGSREKREAPRQDVPSKNEHKVTKQSTPPQKEEAVMAREDRENVLGGLDQTTRKIYDCLPDEGSTTTDKLAQMGLSVSDIASALTMLEIFGLIEQLPGGAYKKR